MVKTEGKRSGRQNYGYKFLADVDLEYISVSKLK
jgi:hypothetical protein